MKADHKQEFLLNKRKTFQIFMQMKRTILFGQRQRGGARHSGAPLLRRYAITSALLRMMAYLSAVSPLLQGR
jgi:hypothetical protein